MPEGKAPDAWRKAASVVLRLSPGECDAVALVFEDEAVSDDIRMLVLDLLAAAGSFEAQIVMRRLLAHTIARRKSRTFAKLVQRLGSVDCPDGPTLRFLMSTYAEASSESHDVRAACAYALGNAAGHSYRSGEPEAAVRATAVLRRDLVNASSADEKCALLTAVGNAGITSDVMLITRFTHDSDRKVRACAALALRKMDVPEARAHLVGMVSDLELEVAERAILALGEQDLDDDDLERLSELVLGGRTSFALDGRILDLLVSEAPKLPPAPAQAGAIENALRVLLGRVDTSDERTGLWMRPGATPPRAVTSASGERAAVSPPTPQPPLPPSQSELRETRALDRPPHASYPSPLPGRAMQQGPLPCSGSYRMVSAPPAPPTPVPATTEPETTRAPAVPTAREHMLALGLDPDAHSGTLPRPPRPDRR